MSPPVNSCPRKKVAIVGGGSAGIAALWALNRSHHDVYVYEAAGRLGGHTNSVEWRRGKFQTLVDTGFVFLSAATYPNFSRFLGEVRVQTVPTPMVFGVFEGCGSFEWVGAGIQGVLRQERSLLSPSMWRMGFDVFRFNQFALDILKGEDGRGMSPSAASSGETGRAQGASQETIGQYLDRERYSEVFQREYLIPMIAALWSTSPGESSLDLPAVTVVRFLWSQGLLANFGSSTEWLTIQDGSKAYVDVVMKGFPPNHLFLNTPVGSVTNDDDGRVRLHLSNGRSAVYDHVILATHGDQAFSLIRHTATEEEKSIMSCFRTTHHTAVLHSGPLPKRRPRGLSSCDRQATSSPWAGRNDSIRASLTYDMNLIQNIPRAVFGHVLLTVDPLHEPDPRAIQGRYKYTRPVYNAAAVWAQKNLARIQNKRGISYAGAWTGYGFVEDGFTSGLLVAQDHLGTRLPFCLVRAPTRSWERGPETTSLDLLIRIVILAVQVFIIDVLDRAIWARALRGTRDLVKPHHHRQG